MFEFLKSDKTEEEEELESMGTVTTESTEIEVVDTDGSALIEKVEELQQAPEMQKKDGEIHVELGAFDGDESITDEEGTIDISASQARNSPLFAPQEVAELERAEMKERLSDEEIESVEKVHSALEDPEQPNTITELWHQACKEEEKFGLSPDNEPETEAEKEREMIESLKEQGYENVEPEMKENKKVQDMTGEEFGQLLAENLDAETSEPSEPETEKEELSEDSEEETAINTPDSEIAELAAESWSDIGGVWSEFAEDLQNTTEDIRVISLGGGKKELRTENEEAKVELQHLHNDESADSRILDKNSGVWVAKVYSEDLEHV